MARSAGGSPQGPYLLVAQHAATEAGIIRNQREHCPALSRIDFIDTILLARQAASGLPNYKLDTLLAHFSIRQPAGRHRVGADVEVTGQVLARLIRAADEMPQFSDLASLVKRPGARQVQYPRPSPVVLDHVGPDRGLRWTGTRCGRRGERDHPRWDRERSCRPPS